MELKLSRGTSSSLPNERRDSGRIDDLTRDTTERTLTEEAARRRTQLYSRLVNSLDCIVWEADARTLEFSFVSPQAERMLGYPAEQWLSPGFWAQHVHPEDVEWCIKFCTQATQQGQDHEFEYRMIAADGRTVWLHDVVSVQLAPHGPERLTGMMIDVTTRKVAETALKESEERFRQVFEGSAAGMVISDASGQILRANQSFCDLVGFPEDELRERSILEITHAGDREATQACLEDIQRGRAHVQELEKRYVRQDGEVVWGRTSVVFLLPDGGAPYSIVVVQDITERKRAEELLRESEERFRAIFENAGLGSSLVDRLGHPIKCNPAIQKMLGFTEQELRSMAFTEFTHPDDIDLDWRLYSELVDGKRDKYEIEKRYITKDGRLMWGRLTVSRVKNNKDGALADYTVGMVEDITERKRAEGELKTAHDQLTKELAERTHAEAEIARLSVRMINAQEEERTRIARELHDNLSQQIAGLGIALSNIKRQIPEDRREAREQAERAYDRVLAIGEAVRYLSHQLHPATLEHSGLVAALESYCAEFESLTKVNATVQAEGPFDDLSANATLGIFRIAQEALQNVWKHSGVREAGICLARAREHMRLQISDRGIGFDPAQPSKEVGLGLVSMRERAKLLGGTFTVESSARQGTTIIVDIPVNPALPAKASE
jgi:PAS domain S-box-containing protein